VKDAATDPLRDLVARYLVGGEEEALEAFVRATKPRLLAVARRIGAPQDAEDAVQSAYLSLLRLRGEGLDAPPLPWLVTTVVRIAYRRKAVHRRHETIARRLSRARETPLPLDLALSGERHEALRVAVAGLPEVFRDPVVLHHLEGLSLAEIAVLLDVPESTVGTRLHRGRRLLESRFPRALLLGLALPWFLTDRAWASAAGGLLVTKKTAALAAVLLVAFAGGLAVLRPWERRPAAEDPVRGEIAAVRAPPPADATATVPTGPTLAGDDARPRPSRPTRATTRSAAASSIPRTGRSPAQRSRCAGFSGARSGETWSSSTRRSPARRRRPSRPTTTAGSGSCRPGAASARPRPSSTWSPRAGRAASRGCRAARTCGSCWSTARGSAFG
jgi:RNA polymerase sigma-70 factor (ECF subfamily)